MSHRKTKHNKKSSSFSSGKELWRARARDQTLPSWGHKEIDPSGSWLEEKQVDARLRDRKMLLEEPKFSRRDIMAYGEWLDESGMVRIVHEAGDFWQYMGAEADIGKCLYPEEAIYLIETGDLEVTYGNVPLSIQQAQAVMLQDSHQMDKYLVYSHLTRNGCRVVRHQPHLWFTQYEKDIRLDQHQVIRKTTKLQLKGKVTKESTKEDLPNEESGQGKIDDAMAEFYASIESVSPSNVPLENTDKGLSSKKENSPKKKRSRNSSDTNEYEDKRRELLSLFPNVARKDVMMINVESSELLPGNSVPTKTSYEISMEALNYYSKYDDFKHTDHRDRDEGQTRWQRGNFRSNYDRSYNRNFAHERSHYSGHQNHMSSRFPMRNYRRGERRENAHWNQHDDRWSSRESYQYDRCSYGAQQEYETSEEYNKIGGRENNLRHGVDMSVRPAWKTDKRRRQRPQRDYYPSCLVKLKVKVNSWQEYKKIVKEMSDRNCLLEGAGRPLWRGNTRPLTKPSLATNTQSILAACRMELENTELKDKEWKISPQLQLSFHFDAYLQNVPYKKSQPTQPSKRIVVMRDGQNPSPGQIMDITRRFHDDVPVVAAVVVCGEVRLYSLTPVNIPQPILSGGH